MPAAESKTEGTQERLLDAARDILQSEGISALSTRTVAQRAGVPLSQIHYHFGSRSGLLLSLLKRENEALLERQTRMYAEDAPLSVKWSRACSYLEEDIRSGYVRTLHEMIASGFNDPEIAAEIRDLLSAWHKLLSDVCAEASDSLAPIGPFTPEEFAMLVGQCFLGLEAMLLLDLEAARVHGLAGLRKFGALIERAEANTIKDN